MNCILGLVRKIIGVKALCQNLIRKLGKKKKSSNGLFVLSGPCSIN